MQALNAHFDRQFIVLDEWVPALYLPAPRLRQAAGLTPEAIKLVEGAR